MINGCGTFRFLILDFSLWSLEFRSAQTLSHLRQHPAKEEMEQHRPKAKNQRPPLNKYRKHLV